MLIHRLPHPAVPARVVVLGGRGFVGSQLVAHLQTTGVPVLPLGTADLDLTQPWAVERLRAVLHPDDTLVFASALTPDKGKDVATLMRNLQMGQHVCAAVAQAPCAHVVYLSSDAVYHDGANPVHERSWCQPSSLYGVMHVARERMLIETLRPSKAPLALVRLSLLYGAADTHNGYGPNRFARLAVAEQPVALFGSGEEKRDHVCVDDVSRLLGLVLAHRSEGVLNIATGESHAFSKVARLVVELSGRGVAIELTPRASPIAHRHFDIAGVIEAFPLFRFTPIRDGLAAMIRALGDHA